MPIDAIPTRLLQRATDHGAAAAYHHKVDGGWRTVTWARYVQQVRLAARSLIALDLSAGATTAILGFNRPEWAIFDHATMMVGAAPAGIYTTCSPEEVQYILGHAPATLALVENLDQWAKIRSGLDQLPALQHVILMDGDPDHPKAMSWSRFLAEGESVADAEVDARLEGLTDDGVATLIYTSGTTGPPKGVMLTHRNLAWTAAASAALTGLGPEASAVSYLPLSHIAEQMFTLHGPATVGSQIYFAESLEALPDHLVEVQPTMIFGVPRVWEKIHAKVSGRLAEATGPRRRLVDWAMGVGRAKIAAINRGDRPSLALRIQSRLAHRLFHGRIKPLLGLGQARLCVTGAAPIAADVLDFFAGLDIVLHEVYGQSEDTGPTSFNVPGDTRFGTVGRPFPGTEVRLADDGEILVRGPHVFAGYLHDPQATAETLVDGWLHSGDLGAFDADGYLTITGRKKEILITAGGKNIAPKNLEAALIGISLVSQAVVIGDRRRFLSALLTLDPEAARRFAADRGLSVDEVHAAPILTEAIQQSIDRDVNPRFARVEHIRRFTVLPREFSQEAGELTPTLKIKRAAVHDHFSDAIEAMYR